ncbi:sigma factor-like helix-turn-helix DNA-binding protein [Longispora sp. NPDC051575]|uniref:sigma factor-like helix-turn-helix DNA-binding protein n=1 Tax=Longispora sp. NPDC051575 TaxID=3154943 RepID=UPI00343987D6
MTDSVQDLAELEDRFEAVRLATLRIEQARQEANELADLRSRLVNELHDEGWSFSDIGKKAGLSRGRIHQIHASSNPAKHPADE